MTPAPASLPGDPPQDALEAQIRGGLRGAAPEPEQDAGLPLGRGGRWLPSFADLFFVSLISWLYLSSKDGWLSLLMDGDIGWHIRAGQWMIANGRVPEHDLFSFSRPGGEWFAWEWLADVVFGQLHTWFGLKGVVLLAGITIALFATILLRYCVWKGANAFVAVGVTLLSVGAASVHFHARPHVFTLLFLTIAVFLVDYDFWHRTRWVWALIPLTVLWTNLHGGFPILIAFLVLTAGGSALEEFLGWRKQNGYETARRYGLLALGCGLASLVNPYGYRVHLHIAQYLRSEFIHNNVMEFMAPNFRTEPLLQFKILLFAGLLCAGVLLLRKQIVPALVLLLFAHQALQSVRHVTLFVIIAAPIVARELTHVWRYWAGKVGRKDSLRLLYQMAQDATPRVGYTTWLPFVFVGVLCVMGEPIRWPKDFPSELFPVKQVAASRELIAGARILAPDQWGDYLLYANYPRQRVFFDGRSDFYGPDLGKDYLALLQGRYDWKALLVKHRIEVVLCPPTWPLASLLKQSAEWEVVRDSGDSVLFRQRRP